MMVALPLLLIAGVYAIGWIIHTNMDTLKRQNWWDVCVSVCLIGAIFNCAILLAVSISKL